MFHDLPACTVDHAVPTSTDRSAGLYPALLKHWRGQRGLSQLDLALAADVSARHVSFLETGRSSPSAEMVVRLGTALDVPLRYVNAMLTAAGHEPVYPEPAPGETIPKEVRSALALMKQHHEPFPLVVIDHKYDVVDMNAGAMGLFAAALGAEAMGALAQAGPMNLVRLTFDPEGAHRVIVNFDEVGRVLLWRLQREVLADPDDGPLRAVLDDALSMPTIDDAWRDADLTVPSAPALVLQMRVGGQELRFVTMVTAFQAPQAVALDELRIETWFPSDDATAAACRALAGG